MSDDRMSALFAAQRAEWEANGPAVLKRAADLGIVLETYGGNCPVQIEGSFDGLRFYFRARGFGWSFQAAPTDGAIDDNTELFGVEHDYPGDAGWMPLHTAIGLVCYCVSEFRSGGGGAQPPYGGR